MKCNLVTVRVREGGRETYLHSSIFSRAANNHVTAFFQDRPIFVFSGNLGYSILKHAL